MRNRPSLILAALTATLAASATPGLAADNSTLTVNFTGLQPKGVVNFMVVDSRDSYDGKAPAKVVDRVVVTGSSASVTLKDLAPGRYALKAFHDLNGDGKMNTNPFGIPLEPFSFSNNARGRMGPTSWEAASFEMIEGSNAQTLAFD